MSPFGGVSHDARCVLRQMGKKRRNTPQVGAGAISPGGTNASFCAADLPFSLIGDVVTWPYVAAYCYINQPIPVPPVNQAPPLPMTAPTLPMPQAMDAGRLPTYPLETLPEPKNLPRTGNVEGVRSRKLGTFTRKSGPARLQIGHSRSCAWSRGRSRPDFLKGRVPRPPCRASSPPRQQGFPRKEPAKWPTHPTPLAATFIDRNW